MATDLPVTHVAAAIIAHEGRVLACQRSYGDMKDGWEFPGGKVEAGETSADACRREIREELGCELSGCWLFTTVEYDYPDFHLSMDCFCCGLPEDTEPHMLEHENMRWLTLGELTDVDWLPADHDLMSQVGMFWDSLFSEMHL
ncbi:MAG: (deoxy)nucleoside triphosphate pyrophosphohydrolase [Atopobiaceae bacterium]|jgi:8-oxo-dGTP diphosphatase|nr:(deoxy)nucleoside triphosphate pyrophosphohydrolase [Atopobiaceae bacterium]MCH4181243.1 (deoxy)nucleoside triphosphate pyrophosphohydrolase [Atopobiaceae bacterium]MCH4214625.1 (deoxy)nucleoside triphosphate pyrophosphohydrolase [Atopobiaceae bacterium]MCH4275780.1 (deoxy)nucleoside triphosphate pyrophosphohydrolase [Atopobiaceae bacterium]MDD2587680.1 (deoxy)nucleoside triphosphate pyrophosphohydrolase [Atopobiaceae bacterium]